MFICTSIDARVTWTDSECVSEGALEFSLSNFSEKSSPIFCRFGKIFESDMILTEPQIITCPSKATAEK